MPNTKSKRNKALVGGASAPSRGKMLIRAPVAQNRSSRQNGRNSMRFKESERIVTIPGSVAFATSASVPCNPGLIGSFPWLAGHANLFENYLVHKLVYRYKNLKGTNSDGNVLFSFDYDTLDDPPGSAVAATQATHYVDGAPWRIFQLNVPTDKRKLFTRSANVAGTDLKTYDMGTLHISTEGCADTTDHGYLEVDYDIEFFNKQPATSSAFTTNFATSMLYLTADQTLTADGVVEYDGLGVNGLNLVADGTGSIVLSPGNYAYEIAFIQGGASMKQVDLIFSPATPTVPPSDLVDPATTVGTNTVHSNVGTFTIASDASLAERTLLVRVDWTSGTATLGKDINRLIITRI